VAKPSDGPPGARGEQGAAQQAPSPGDLVRPTEARCELCSGGDRYSHWIEVGPEGEGISCVTVDVTLRLCPDHRARLLQALNRDDSDVIEPSRELKGWGVPE
jgi:hypothetical protein